MAEHTNWEETYSRFFFSPPHLFGESAQFFRNDDLPASWDRDKIARNELHSSWTEPSLIKKIQTFILFN